jgi:hypothetical protein
MLIPGFERYDISEGHPHDVTHVASGRVRRWTLSYDGYYQTSFYKDGRRHTVRRARLIALCWIPNPEGKLTIDHINRDRADDRVDNLRWATHAEQTQNRGPASMRRDNTSGVRGVNWYKQSAKWQAQITVDGTRLHLGYFDGIHDAEAAYLAKRRELGRE